MGRALGYQGGQGLVMNRRSFLVALGLAPVAAGLGAVPAQAGDSYTLPKYTGWRGKSVFRLQPGATKRMAWTVDDGFHYEALRRYVRFVRRNRIRITFFVVAGASPWVKLQPQLQPMIDSGQVQIANHTARHRDLTKLSNRMIQRELMDNHNFILETFGVDARPFFRPPYGAINMRVVRAAAAVGYTKPIIWSGTLADASNISTAAISGFARRYIFNGVVLLGHANNLRTSPILGYIWGLAKRKGLQLVTLNDVYTPRYRGPANVAAVAGDASATVSWLPVKNARTYTVTATPGGASLTVQAPAVSAEFSGLTNGEAYTFTVHAVSLGVRSYESVASAAVTPSAPPPPPA